MTDLTPAPTLTIRRWLLSTIATSVITVGALFALFVVFNADGFFDIGEDPAIPNESNLLKAQKAETQRLGQRIEALESALAKTTAQQESPHAVYDPVLAKKLEQASAETAELKEKVAEIRHALPEENRTNMLVAGLTQLKAAYENDLSLRYGIATLTASTEDAGLREKLGHLQTMVDDNVPSRKDILQQLDEIKHSTEQQNRATNEQIKQVEQDQQTAQEPATEQVPAWKKYASETLNRFVTVRSSDDVAQTNTLNQIEQAIYTNNYPVAAHLASKLPANPKTELLLLKLKARAKVQKNVQAIIAKTTTLIGTPTAKGALY